VPQPSNLSSISPTTTTCYLAILELPLDLPHTHKTAFETNNHKSSPETEKGDEIERGKSDARETQNHTQFPFFSKFDDLLGSLGVGIVQHSKRRKVPGGRPAHRWFLWRWVTWIQIWLSCATKNEQKGYVWATVLRKNTGDEEGGLPHRRCLAGCWNE
jgi:hypothetical protein